MKNDILIQLNTKQSFSGFPLILLQVLQKVGLLGLGFRVSGLGFRVGSGPGRRGDCPSGPSDLLGERLVLASQRAQFHQGLTE